MNKIFLIFIISLNFLYGSTAVNFKYANNYDIKDRDEEFERKIVNQLLNGKLDKTLSDLKPSSTVDIYGFRALLRGHAYILKGNYQKAKLNYLRYATTNIYSDDSIQEIKDEQLIDEHIKPFYKELSVRFPDKKTNLKEGLKIYNNIIPLIEKWKEQAPAIEFNQIYGAILIGLTPKKAQEVLTKGIRLSDAHAADENYKIGVTSLSEHKFLIKIGNRKHYKIIKDSKIKVNSLVLSMLKYKAGVNSKEKFLSTYKLLKKNKCKSLKGNFSQADEYDNKGQCYFFGAKMYQRLDRTNGLADGGRNLFYVIFDKSWRDGEYRRGYIKGLGNYKYQTSRGSMKNVSKGKVIKFN